MNFLGSLGIDIKLLIAQMINFGLLLWLVTKFLYKPIIRRIEKDEIELKQAQIQKEKLGQEKNTFDNQKKNEIVEAKNHAREIIKEAENIAKEIKKHAKKETEREKQAVIKQIQARLTEIDHAQKIK